MYVLVIPPFFMKLFEFMLTILCIVFFKKTFDVADIPTMTLCFGTYLAYIVVLSGELLGEIKMAPLELIQELYYSVIAVFLFASCAILLLSKQGSNERTGVHHTGDVDATKNLGYISLVVSLVFAYDVVLAIVEDEGSDNLAEKV